MFRASRVSKRTGFEREAKDGQRNARTLRKQANTAAATRQRSILALDRALARVIPSVAIVGPSHLQALLRRIRVVFVVVAALVMVAVTTPLMDRRGNDG